jgi:hypothetical protein
MSRLIMVFALAGALAGCETFSTIDLDANMYSVRGATLPLRSGGSVSLVNGYSGETKSEIGSHAGTHFVVDLRQATEAAAAMTIRELQKKGVTVDANAKKKVTLRVANVKTAFHAKPFTMDSRFRTSLLINVECDGGPVAIVFAENAAVALGGDAVKRGVEGATMFAVTKLLNDQKVVDYLNR